MVQFECPRAILIPFTFGVYYEVPGESLPEHARRVQARGTEFNTAAIKWMKVAATAMVKAATGTALEPLEKWAEIRVRVRSYKGGCDNGALEARFVAGSSGGSCVAGCPRDWG